MKVEIDLPELPDGYEYTGRYENLESGMLWANAEGRVREYTSVQSGFLRFTVQKKKWRPEVNDTVWCLGSTGEVCTFTWLNRDHGLKLLKFGNVFKSVEEAKTARDKIREVLNSDV